MIDEDRSTWTLGKLADEVIEACELPTGCRATIIAALGDAKDQGAAELRHQSGTQPAMRMCHCADPENCTERIPGYACRADNLRHQVCNDDARDAERYRWLVKNCHLHEAPENFGRYTYSKTWLDSRVDECMARHAKGEVGVSADALRALQSHQTSFHVAGKKS